MKKNLIIGICGICCISFLLFGFMLGIQTQTLNMIKIAEAIQIEEMNIDFNETKTIDAIMLFFEENGYIEEMQKQAETKQTPFKQARKQLLDMCQDTCGSKDSYVQIINDKNNCKCG